MKLQFTKMQGLGNDFVIMDGINQTIMLSSGQIRAIADRHFGVGCDQLLMVERPTQSQADFRYRIFNADGGEVAQCGNGARCFGRFIRDKELTTKNEIPVETASGLIRLWIENDGQVTVDMGYPRLAPEDIPFIASTQALHYALSIEGNSLEIGAVSMGNPHAILLVDDINKAPVASLGSLLTHHERFPEQVNVGFMEIVTRRHIRLRVFERGSGETMACGSGACAAMVIGYLWNLLDDFVQVELPGGHLTIRWPHLEASVLMTGPAVRVFEGWLDL